uniref:HECT-type E3 ubiquitin transferase n=1 Tax=Nothobranchius furzeri TaxID=105023 RepID=A0A8C6NUT7_NOTFU
KRRKKLQLRLGVKPVQTGLGQELPPISSDIRHKQRLSIDTLPLEVKAPFPCDPIIPLRSKTTKEFQGDMEHAIQSGDWREIREFYLTTFNSFIEINAAFKREANGLFNTTEDSGVNAKFVSTVYDALLSTPQDIQKSVLKGIINSLLREWKGPRTKNDLRAYFILIQNPQYSSSSIYVIFAHLLRQIAALSEADHHFLVHWLKRLSARRFRQLVERLLQFISTRLFPAETDELPPSAKCSWWVPSATKVLSLFNAANSVSCPPIMPFTDFYNITLEHIDFMEDYRTWQNYGNSNRSEMLFHLIGTSSMSLVSKVSRRQRVDMNLLFLNIKVRRAQLLSDSLDELTRKRCDLKKKLRVTFVGEAGLDMGGLTKEWFLLLVRQIFHTDYGMFTYMKDSHCHWFSSWKSDNYSEFQMVGTLMGLAVYNSIALDIHFPLYCYRKLLTPPTVPCDQNVLVGMATATLDDLQQVMPDLAHGLSELLSYQGNVEEDFHLTFQVFQEEMGVVKSYNLKAGGDKIPVTKQNRKEYVQLYIDFLLNKSIYTQFAAFYHGFHSVCASDALMVSLQGVCECVCMCVLVYITFSLQWLGSSRRAHITPVLQSLRWLPVEYRIQFKVLVLTYRALNNQAPSYLSELLSPHTTSLNLRSTSENLLAVPRTRLKTKGDRAFQTIAPRLWNSLPSNLRLSNTVEVF